MPAIIADPVVAAFGRSGFAVLGAFSWALLVAGACAPRVGKWIDHHGGRGALIGSIVVIALGQAVLRTMGLNASGFLGHLPLLIAFIILAVYTYQSGLRAPALIALTMLSRLSSTTSREPVRKVSWPCGLITAPRIFGCNIMATGNTSKVYSSDTPGFSNIK